MYLASCSYSYLKYHSSGIGKRRAYQLFEWVRGIQWQDSRVSTELYFLASLHSSSEKSLMNAEQEGSFDIRTSTGAPTLFMFVVIDEGCDAWEYCHSQEPS